MNIYISIFLLALTSCTTAQKLTLPSLPPPNKPKYDALELKVYLNKLSIAVQERDTEKLKKLMIPDIKLTLGPESDKPPEEILELANSNSWAWKELETILQLGGTFRGPNNFGIPYTFTKFPRDIEAYSHQVLIKPFVIARNKPNKNASKVAILEFAIVRHKLGTPKTIVGIDGTRWIEIYLNGTVAYIPQEAARSPIDFRAGFEKRKTGWIMTTFLAGD